MNTISLAASILQHVLVRSSLTGSTELASSSNGNSTTTRELVASKTCGSWRKSACNYIQKKISMPHYAVPLDSTSLMMHEQVRPVRRLEVLIFSNGSEGSIHAESHTFIDHAVTQRHFTEPSSCQQELEKYPKHKYAISSLPNTRK